MNKENIEFREIVLYDIERNGSLNGVYTNNHPSIRARIFTETARLKELSRFEGRTEIREYDSLYFDVNEWIDCTLTFRVTNGIYYAIWQKKWAYSI